MIITNATVDSDPTLNDVDTLVFRDPTDTEMTPKKIVILSVMTTSNVFMLLGNSFSIYIILCSPSLRKHTYYWLVLNLAVLDLMNSSFVVPINIVWEFYGNWPFGQLLCDIEIFCDLGFSTVAAYSTVLLSLDKYLYITKPFFYHTYVGPKWTVGSILATWVVWMTYSAASIFGELARSTKEYKYSAFPLDNCNFVLRHVYAITSFVLVFFIPLLILVFTSSRILYVARQHIRKIHHNHRVSDVATSSLDLSAVSPANTNRRASEDTPTLRQSSSDKSEPPPPSTNNSTSNKKKSLEVATTSDQYVMSCRAAIDTDSPSGGNGADVATRSSSWARKGKKSSSNSLRAFGTVTLVVFAYIVMFAPYWIAAVVNLGCICIEPMIFEDYLAVLYYMHSLVNPYIYMATDRRYKKAIRILTARWKCCILCRRRTVSPVIQISSINH